LQNKGGTIVIAKQGTEEYRYLEFINAEANVGGANMTHILLKENPSKAAVLEEFLHGTQQKLGIIDRIGTQGAEVHVKNFMIRHQKLLGLGHEDVNILKILRDRDIELLNQSNGSQPGYRS
jgi:hypothetical protein